MRIGPLPQPEAGIPLKLPSVLPRGLSTVVTAVPLSLSTRVALTTNDKPEMIKGALMSERPSLGMVLGQTGSGGGAAGGWGDVETGLSFCNCLIA